MNKRQKTSKRTTECKHLPSEILSKVGSYVLPHDRAHMGHVFKMDLLETMDKIVSGMIQQQENLKAKLGRSIVVSYNHQYGIKFTIDGFYHLLHVGLDVTSKESEMVWHIFVHGDWKPLRNPQNMMVLESLIPDPSWFEQEDRILWMQSRCIEILSWVCILWNIAPACLHDSL
jgi:hypothetical protein